MFTPDFIIDTLLIGVIRSGVFQVFNKAKYIFAFTSHQSRVDPTSELRKGVACCWMGGGGSGLCHNSYLVKPICSLSRIQTLIYLRFISAASSGHLSVSSIGSSFKYEADQLPPPEHWFWLIEALLAWVGVLIQY